MERGQEQGPNARDIVEARGVESGRVRRDGGRYDGTWTIHSAELYPVAL